MQPGSRAFRQILYRLKDVEDMVRAAKLTGTAGELARAGKLHGISSTQEFLDECRLVLENLLVGEAGLSSYLIGEVLELIGLIDEELIALAQPLEPGFPDESVD